MLIRYLYYIGVLFRYTTSRVLISLNVLILSSFNLVHVFICLSFISPFFSYSFIYVRMHFLVFWVLCYLIIFSPYLTENTLRLRYRDQPVNAVWGNSRCLLWESYRTHKYTVWAECRDFIYKNSVRTSQETHHVSATESNRLMLFR
jgi:hypothetical protein